MKTSFTVQVSSGHHLGPKLLAEVERLPDLHNSAVSMEWALGSR